jgi:hypothetical protein
MSPSTGTTAETESPQVTRADVHGITTQIVICLGPWYDDAQPERLSPVLQVLREALGPQAANALVTYPVNDPQASTWQHEGMLLQPYVPSTKLHALAVQTGTTFLSLNEVMREHSATCGLLLGAEAHTLSTAAIRGLIDAVLDHNADLALARYATSENESLINAAILYPISRAVFGVKAHFPLALDLAMSSRMAERMANTAQSKTTTTQPEALVWPAAEAAVAGYTVAEVDAGVRNLPHPTSSDLSSILNTIASSLFLDVETKATFWQRTRPAQALITMNAVQTEHAAEAPVPITEVAELIDSFRIGYGNLHEIWALVLPPQTLLGLKRLSKLTPDEFQLPDTLWVRIVYDFILAHRLRVINRGHLMGALTPLYLAWVASHIIAGQTSAAPDAAESLVRAFEADKPYLVSRWRWPDRFNP